MAQVIFDISEFRTMYPGLTESQISDTSLNSMFTMSESIVGNTDGTSFAEYDPSATPPKLERKWMLYAVTCHLATLQVNNPNGVAGRVASASEGSVSTSFDLIRTNSQSAQWWNQTQCGALYWVLSAKYRLGGRLYARKKWHPYG